MGAPAVRPWRVWVTRSAPGARTTAAAIRALGHRPVVAPLIATRLLAAGVPTLDGVAALAFTSAAGVRAFAEMTPRRDRPVFAVGRATAEAARAAGFAAVHDADGDARALAARLADAAPSGVVLVPGAREPAFDLPVALADAGVTVWSLPAYAVEPVRPPPSRALALLAAGRFQAVLLQSASAARAFQAAAAALDLATPPSLLALSPACAPPSPQWPVLTAVAPRTRDLLALLPRLDTSAPPR